MPFYELFCIAAQVNYKNFKELVASCANHVMDSGGVVRKIHYLGACALSQPQIRQKLRHDVGDYWLMHFDANPKAMHALGRRLRKDPLVLRWTMTKLSEKVEDNFLKKAKTISFHESVHSAALRSTSQTS